MSSMEAKRILIRGVNWLGDAVMMGALIQRLKAADPARGITVLTPAHLEDVVRRLPGVADTSSAGHPDPIFSSL